MHALLNFSYSIVQGLLGLIEFFIIANAIMSWLIAFDIVNMRNQAISQIARGLDALTRPLLRPVQRLLPSMGGIDISPVIVILVIEAARNYLIGPFFGWLHVLVGGAAAV